LAQMNKSVDGGKATNEVFETTYGLHNKAERGGLSSTFPIRSAKWPRLAHPPPAGASYSDAVKS